MLAVAILQARQLLGQKKILLLGLFLLIPVGLCAIVASQGGFAPKEFEPPAPGERAYSYPPGYVENQTKLGAGLFLFLLYPQSICVLLSLLYGTSLINGDLEGKTLTYLFTRAIAKWKVLVSKYVAIAASLVAAATVSLAVSWIVLGMPGGVRFLAALWLATAGALATYTAIFAAIGAVFPKRPIIVGLVYGVVETMLSFIPALVSTLTVTYFLRSLAQRVARLEIPKELTRVVGDASIPAAMLVLAAMAAGAMAVAAWVTTTREYVMTDQV